MPIPTSNLGTSYFLILEPSIHPNRITMRFTSALSALIGLSMASESPAYDPTEKHSLARREPGGKSGTSQIVLQCKGVTIPYPGGDGGQGEGGGSYFTSNLLFNADGTQISAEACTETSSTCTNCLFSDGRLSSPANVTACWFPPSGESGCSIEFQYNGYDYNSQNSEPKCGHTNGFSPFSFDLSAICYFDV